MELIVLRNNDFPDLDKLADKIRSEIDNENIIVIKHMFPQDNMSQLVNEVWEWGLKQENQTTDYSNFRIPNFKMRFQNDYSANGVYGISSEFDMLKTPTQYTLFRFSDFEQAKTTIPEIQEISGSLSKLSNCIANTSHSLGNVEGVKFNLEINHYPTGGGHMEMHNHKEQYSKPHTNLILGLAKNGKDFKQGSTFFEHNGTKIDTAEIFDQGDVLVFPVHIAHGVSPCDPDQTLDFDNITGRWTAILPAYNPSAS